jgi:hypothetical protein
LIKNDQAHNVFVASAALWSSQALAQAAAPISDTDLSKESKTQ